MFTPGLITGSGFAFKDCFCLYSYVLIWTVCCVFNAKHFFCCNPLFFRPFAKQTVWLIAEPHLFFSNLLHSAAIPPFYVSLSPVLTKYSQVWKFVSPLYFHCFPFFLFSLINFTLRIMDTQPGFGVWFHVLNQCTSRLEIIIESVFYEQIVLMTWDIAGPTILTYITHFLSKTTHYMLVCA